MRSTLLALCRDAENGAAGDVSHGGRSRKGVGHWAFAVLVGCVALLALAPVAIAAGTGSIEGTVTESAHKALAKVSVTVYGADEEFEGTASTNASGEYTVSGLSSGQYKVGFSDQPTYTDQYYNKQSSFEGASFVSVTEGNATSGIDAEMLLPGKITGSVTNSSGAPIANVNVDIYNNNFNYYEPARFAETNANGEYTVEGLVEGEYKIGFSPENSTYLPQYYNGQTSLANANPISVTTGATTAGVNATLVEGAKISGVVTDAYSHVRLAKIRVGASTSGSGEGGYGSAETNANGEYTIVGLPTGSYKVVFYWENSEAEYKACAHMPSCPPKYITQYFNDQPSEVTANSVTAAVGTVASGINAAMVPAAPFNTAAPSVSGTATTGSLLSCASGSWTGENELTLSAGWPLTSPFSYQWLRDGAPIAGATAPAYTVQAADVGHALVCEVTAINVAGRTSARSSSLAVTLPAVTLSSSKVAVSGGSAKVPIACANATCTGTIELVGQVTIKSKGKKAKRKTVTLAKGSYSLAAGKKATISVRLTSVGKSALAATKAHKLSCKAGVTVTSGATVKKSVVLSEARTKGKRK